MGELTPILGLGLSLGGLLIAQFSLLWYKLGKVEQRVKDHCEETTHCEERGK